MNAHLKGLLLTTLGVLFVVPDSLFVRLIEAEPLVVAFWRGITAGVFILVGVLAFMPRGATRAALSTGWPGVIYIVLMGSTAPGFVLAVTQTSVANVVFIFASMPVFAAIFGKVFLGEGISKRMVLTMLGVFAGLAIIAYGSGENEIASWKGDVWAVIVCASYAGALTAVRQLKDISMIPAIPVAYIGAGLVVLPFVSPWVPVAAQWHLFALHGGFIAVATCFLTLGPRYISSAEVSLLILLESVLAPLLVWAVVGEDPGRWAIVGGAVVIGALLVSNMVALRRRR
ncbi:EamA-like transporter family protein [Roseovarius sp. THAF9]|uniref:DMT family transporter n=1 Tax=Roseovarius sp. THAF9 TaxID=2587847 RepID=UPI001268C64B|nr:DMT family transporter [Roseovarius sp. THAF9]QFT94807.1 EamA-like transporter family protein [Roseovarius sp. THAF9]